MAAAEDDKKRKKELEQIAVACSWVPENRLETSTRSCRPGSSCSFW